ncbi:hypothetical protein JTB14_034000 [Gonioctena quinquepunctata]|nr:hypothetical protein JTB14_034000 [Gonioctena quinquepunctata]
MQIGKESNASKCYGIYGCFQLNAPWTSENRPVSLFPEDMEPKYLLYTRQNSKSPKPIDISYFEYTLDSNEFPDFDPENPIYLITHGYMEGGSIDWIYNITRALLDQEECSVIVIDWQKGSGPPYTQAVANIRLVGVVTAHILNDLSKFTGDLKLDHVHAIGHSLGAHMCGYIGYTLKKEFNLTLGRITGMDPAEPHFSKSLPPVRLDRSAANYVDIIHTDASQFIRGGLGMQESIGHIDYYPNGGTDQPGCTSGVVHYIKEANGSFFYGVKKYLSCNHMRSHELFLESLTVNPKCPFMTVECSSFQEFKNGNCFDCGRDKEKCLPFGFHGRKHYEKQLGNRLRHTSRVQYLITGATSPFCRSHYRITVQVSNSNHSKMHGGEIGQLFLTMHSTSDGRGQKSAPIGFFNGFHEPGGLYRGVVATDGVPNLKAVEIQWKYDSSMLNPLTWRLLSAPRIYLKKVLVEALEIDQRIHVCPKSEKALINGIPQLMISSYC